MLEMILKYNILLVSPVMLFLVVKDLKSKNMFQCGSCKTDLCVL